MLGRFLLLLAAILGLGLSLTACGPQTPHREPCPAGERCLEYGNGGDPQSLDPQIATTVNEAAILRELFDGMFTDNPDGSPTPGLAKTWEVSPDGLTWTFHMRPEQWSDGQPVTANDFVFAYRRMLDPKTASSYAYLLYVLKNAEAVNGGKAPPESLGARAIDDETLQLTLEHPASYLPQLLKHQAFFPIPAHLVSQKGESWDRPGVMVSNGAYTLTSWALGDYVRIQKNPRFRDAANVCFDRVDFLPTLDHVSAERRVLRGELDIDDAIVSNRLRKLRADPTSAPYAHSHSYLSTVYLALNIKDVPALRDLHVRQAISMAIDRDFIALKVLGGGQVPTTSFVPLGIADYLPHDAPHPGAYWVSWPLERRQAEARRLLAAAGYPMNHPLTLELKTIDGGNNAAVQSVQSDLRSVGINIDLRLEDGGVLFQSLNERDFQMGIAGWIADFNDPMTYLTLLKSDTGQQNYGDYNNPTYDALLNKADNEPDAAKRTAYLAQAEQLALDDANLVPLYDGVNSNLVNPHITGWVDNDSDIHPIRALCRNDAPAVASK
ncbi:MAG TPA: peptide ABC transporter substrate-binding protein [Caulobacteraceae bacterium]|jgi:oligopeptide transport system substrate-binding protein|nr:peptide ABC transporter substrate-binding protein [Caulobacteraceae bacterium]